MPSRQDLLIYAAAVLANGAWLFAALAVVGFACGQGGSPFAWPAVFVLLVTAIVATRAIAAIPIPHLDRAIVQAGLGVMAAYCAIAFSDTASAGGFAPLWALRFIAGDYDATKVIGIGVGIFGAVYIWRHGMLMAAAELLESRLHRSFRFGIIWLGLALLIGQASDRDLGASGMLLPFFAGNLAALAMARLRHNNAVVGDWIRVIGAAIVVFVGLGLGFTLLGGVVVRETATMAMRGWGYVADGLLWVLRLVLEPIARIVAAAVEWLLDHMPAVAGRPTLRQQGDRWWEKLGLDATTPEEAIGALLLYPMLILIFVVVCWILLKAYRYNAVLLRPTATEYRERLAGDTAGDLARILSEMLPSWLRLKPRSVVRWRYLEDDPGVADAFRLYYDTLGLAGDRGLNFDPCLTPTERIPHLARVLPGVPVDRITACFIAACYGHKRIEAAEAAVLRGAVDHAKMAAPASS